MTSNNIVDYVKQQKNTLIEELNQIKNSKDDVNSKRKKIDEIYLKTEEVKKYVHQYLATMIAYDIRTCQELIKELETIIKNERSSYSDTKSFKFSFAKKNSTSKAKHSENDKANEVTDTIDMSNQHNLINGFKDLSNQELSLDRAQTTGKDIVLESLNHCQVEITGVPTSLRLINLKNCSVFTGPIPSSTYIEKCNNCHFKIIAQQLRIHETKECDIYLHVTSRTIIEDSSKLRFAPYNWSYDHLNEDLESSAINMKTNNWRLIDDFNCPNSISSNWSLLEN